jgi:signal peptidase I
VARRLLGGEPVAGQQDVSAGADEAVSAGDVPEQVMKTAGAVPRQRGVPRSDRIGRVRKLLPLLVVTVLAGAGGCGGATAVGKAEQFTQGGVSMEPTVKAGQVITVRAVGRDYKPRRGDIVLFHGGGGQWGDSAAPFLKRVIAVGGETIACCDTAGKVTINGRPLDEPYVANDAPPDMPPSAHSCGPRRFGPVAVATGTVFVMGDNRAASNDSRCAGPIPATSIFAVLAS